MLQLDYSYTDDAASQYLGNGHILGAITFGNVPEHGNAATGCAINLAAPEGGALVETWRDSGHVEHVREGSMRYALTEDVLFGCLQTPLRGDLSEIAYAMYRDMFGLIDRHGHHLVRVWHYLPGISEVSQGRERYHDFNAGRHRAFIEQSKVFDVHAPAACALGTRDDTVSAYFLAARTPGHAIENPSQVSAYHYPPEYGPKSPVFSRAMLWRTADQSVLFVSGTASIVGHRTLHAGDPENQLEQTIDNLRIVMGEARKSGWQENAGTEMLLKVYLRDSGDLAWVAPKLEQAFGPQARIVYLEADICRRDLLLEIEVTCFTALN